MCESVISFFHVCKNILFMIYISSKAIAVYYCLKKNHCIFNSLILMHYLFLFTYNYLFLFVIYFLPYQRRSLIKQRFHFGIGGVGGSWK